MSASVDPIPKDASPVAPHLAVPVRDAAGAIDLYAKAFDAEEVFRMPGPDGGRPVHAGVRIDGGAVMLAGEAPRRASARRRAWRGRRSRCTSMSPIAMPPSRAPRRPVAP